jgi:hypothetical protein
MFVGMTAWKFIGSCCLRYPDQSSVVEHAWELRTHSRRLIVADNRRPEGKWEGEAMQVMHPVCCRINVQQARLTAWLRCVEADGR